MLAKEELLNKEFIKWPQMRVVGKKITQEQAWEVIRRTDCFFVGYGGNDKEFNKYWGEKLTLPRYTDTRKGHDYSVDRQWEIMWGVIDLEYLHNNWLSCAFIGGPHGWCSPKGNLYYADNIGKWPKSDEVLKEWSIIAKEFPFLELDAVIMSEESRSEEKSLPILRYHVEKGKVTIFSPKDSGLGMVEHWQETEENDMATFLGLLFSPSFEHHPLAKEMLESYVSKFADKIKEFEEWEIKQKGEKK